MIQIPCRHFKLLGHLKKYLAYIIPDILIKGFNT